jgi:deoxyribodipyrimidine photolyase
MNNPLPIADLMAFSDAAVVWRDRVFANYMIKNWMMKTEPIRDIYLRIEKQSNPASFDDFEKFYITLWESAKGK